MVMKVLFVIMILNLNALAQGEAISLKYLILKPVSATRQDVLNQFGEEMEAGKNSYRVSYYSKDKMATVVYSPGFCTSMNQFGRLPEWTVEEIFYWWREGHQPRLEDVITDQKKFVPRRLGDVADHVYYVDDEDGITVVYDETLKRVLDLSIQPNKEARQKYRCP